MTQLEVNPLPGVASSPSQWELFERAAAFGACFIIGSRLILYQQITIGYLLAFALVPVVLPVAWRVRAVRALLAVVVICLISGLVLAAFRGQFRGLNRTLMVMDSVEILGVAATAVVLYWAMKRLGPGWVAVAYSLGMLVFVNQTSDLYSTNPWRFGYALPVSLLILAIAAVARNLTADLVGMIVVVGVAVVDGGRSSLASKLIALLLVVFWMLRSNRNRMRVNVFGVLLSLGLLAWTIQAVLQSLLLDGILGEQLQAKSQAQVLTSGGSLILGGRPEAGATIALFIHRFVGFGLGVRPSWADVEAARSGMAAVGYDPNSGYVDHYMFGDGFRLHSMAGDLWTAFGLAGIALCLVIGWHCIKSIALGPTRRGADALILMCTTQTLWNLGFSPWYSSISVLTLLLPLLWYRLPEAQGPPLRAELDGMRA